MSGLSEAALHVQAMRFVCKALADREQQGIEVDWDVLRQMHDQMDAMIQALQHKHRYDSSDMVDLRKDRDHWRQARQEAHEAGELMKAELETLRKELANAQRELSEQSMVANVETQQDAAAWQQQVDSANAEVSYLRARLDEERSVIAGLRQQLRTAAGRVDLTEENNRSLREQLDAANAAVTLQRAGIERLQAFVNLSRRLLGGTVRYADVNRLRAALAELDAGTEPAPVAEPVPQSELSEEMQDAVPPTWAPLVWDLRRRLAAAQAALTSERLDAEGGA